MTDNNNNETVQVAFGCINMLPPLPTTPVVARPIISDEEFNSTIEWLKQNYEEFLPEFANLNERHWLRISSNHPSSGDPGYWEWTNMYIADFRIISNSTEQNYSQNMRRVATFAIYYGEHNDKHYRMPRDPYYRYANLIKRYHDKPPISATENT